jgi:hypothetical protein
MKFHFEELGPLKVADIEISPLTILCGCNNTGKTYVTIAIYGFLKFWHEGLAIQLEEKQRHELIQSGVTKLSIETSAEKIIEQFKAISAKYEDHLPRVFAFDEKLVDTMVVNIGLSQLKTVIKQSIDQSYFDDISLGTKPNKASISISKDADSAEVTITLLSEKLKEFPKPVLFQFIGESLKYALFPNAFPEAFISSAERTGAAIFRNELNFTRNRMFEQLSQKEDINPFDFIHKYSSDYPLPVKHNVEFMRDLEATSKRESYIKKEHPHILEQFNSIIGGKYIVSKDDQLTYTPASSRKLKLKMGESSSAVRSLLDLGFYLHHQAKTNDMLMIDEPELNLHPSNQRCLARLLASLVNIGIKVFITTHSDYIVREFNTLITLNNPHPDIKKVAQKYGYLSTELLDYKKVSLYTAKEHPVLLEGNIRKKKVLTLVPAIVSPTTGIDAKTFDDTIGEMSIIQERIMFALDED